MTVGKKIRELRQAKGWTLAELSKRSGVALSSLSRIETGKMTGTLESHLQIARSFGIRLPEMYAELDASGPPAEIRRTASEPQRFLTGGGMGSCLLTSSALRKKMLPVLVSLKPGKSARPEQGPVGTERFLYLVKGRLEVTAGKEQFRMNPGDSLYFQASLPHLYKNVGPGPSLTLSVTSPPSL